MDNASQHPRPFLAFSDQSPATPFAASGSMMGHSAPNPALSLPQHAYGMHVSVDAEARSLRAAFLRGYVCLYSQCEAPPFPDPGALEEHLQQEHYGSPGIRRTAYRMTEDNDLTQSTAQGHGGWLNIDYTSPSPSNAALYNPSLYTSAGQAGIGYYHCPHLGCDVSARRMPDLERHMKKHDSGPKPFSCPMRDCDRHGDRGFARKDKLNDHLKAKHKMVPM